MLAVVPEFSQHKYWHNVWTEMMKLLTVNLGFGE